jgi:hypothetical protein
MLEMTSVPTGFKSPASYNGIQSFIVFGFFIDIVDIDVERFESTYILLFGVYYLLEDYPSVKLRSTSMC